LQGEFIINIAGNEIISLRQLCNLIGKLVNKEPIFKIINIKQNDLIADIEFMKKHLYSPIVNLETGIKKLIEDTT
jgi:nucleoside-diphosphate-sugar epimerase